MKHDYTIDLNIPVKDLEKQFKVSAKNIKEMLRNVAQESNSLQYFGNLSTQLAQIDDQMAKMRAEYGDGIIKMVSGSVKEEFQSAFDFAKAKLAEFESGITADKTHLASLESMLTDFNKAKVGMEQVLNEKTLTGFKGTKKEVQEMYKMFDGLVAKKNELEASGDFTSEAYLKNYIQLMKTAAGLMEAGNLGVEGHSFGIDLAELKGKADQAKQILQGIAKEGLTGSGSLDSVKQSINTYIDSAKTSMEAWAKSISDMMQDSIKAMLSGSAQNMGAMVAQNKKIAASYDEVSEKLSKYLELKDKENDGIEIDADGKDIAEQIGELDKYFDKLGESVGKLEQIQQIISDFSFGDIDKGSALGKLSDLLSLELPKDLAGASAQMQEFLNLAKTYGGMEYISENDANAGIKKLEEMKTGLIDLYEQGKLTTAELNAINDAFDSTTKHLQGMDHGAHAGTGGQDPVKRWNEIVEEIDERGIESSSDADHYEGQLDEIKDQIDALHELGKVSDEVMKQVEADYENIRGTIKSLRASETILNELGHLNNQATLTEDSNQLKSIVQERKKLIAIAEEESYWSNEVLEIQKAITEEIEKRINAKKSDVDDAGVNDLEQQKKLLREIKNAYKKQYDLQDKYDNADDPDKLEAKLEAAKDKVKEFEDQYHSVVVTLSDGMKIHLQFDDDDFVEDTEKLLKNAKKLQDIEFISKDVGSAIDAHTMLQSWKTLKDIGKDMRDFGASSQKEIRTKAIASLEEYIQRIDKFDPNFKYGNKEDYDRAIQFLETIKATERASQMKKPLMDAVEQFAQLNNLDLADLRDAYNSVLEEVRKGTYTTVDQCMAKFKELAAPVQAQKAYNDVFDVLSKISDKWKDLDTVDSAIGSMPLGDIDTYIQKLEGLIKLIESVDPNFQHGDKTEYDGAIKTLEKMKELSARTKLTDEFKNTINQFEQLGKFQWSDELTNGYGKILEDIKNGTYKTIGQCVAKFNELSAAAAKPKLMEPTEALKELVNYVSKSGSTPKTFFSKLESGAIDLNDELKNILQSLDAIGADGKAKLTSLQAGYINQGGFVSDKYAMIARPMKSSYGVNYLKKAQNLQGKLQDAQQAGAQIGAIFQIIEDATHNLFYEVQNTVPGTAAFSHHKQTINADIANASVDQLEQLVNTIQILAKNGLFIDFGGDNILYDKDKGFSVIDLGVAGGQSHTVSYQNTLQENLDRFVKEIFSKSSASMKQTLQDGLVKNLYASAQKMDVSIVNPYAPKQTQTAKVAQAASTQTAAAVKNETDKHEDNATAIKAENDALEAQIELKKKAQSMKWEAFATDDSLAALKQAAGMKTLGQLEGFWKDSNYEKNIAFHEIPEAEAKALFNKKLPKGLASKWYGAADFSAKSKLENEILADDELRNAAMSFFYQLYKKMPASKQNPNVKNINDFVNTEFTMYRGDQAPLIYDPYSMLSFSLKDSVATGFDSHLGTAKIKPKYTIGNAGSGFYSEAETFMPSKNTSWYQRTGEKFEDFYAKQTKEMQKEIDAGLVAFEKKRVSDILGDDLTALVKSSTKSSYWKHNVADSLKKGEVLDQLAVPTDGSDYADFAKAYNGMSETMKNMVMYFATLDEVSANLPKPLTTSMQFGSGFKYGKNAVGNRAKLFNAVLNDPEGRNDHIAKLTGEYAFNLMGNAMQKTLAETKDQYDSVQYDLWDKAFDAKGRKSSDLSALWSLIHDVNSSDQKLINKGMYKQKSTGKEVDAQELYTLVGDIEQKYNENLDFVKDYLKNVFANIELDDAPELTKNDTQQALKDVKTQLYSSAKSAHLGGNDEQYFKTLAVLNHLNDVGVAREEDIKNAKYTLSDTGETLEISHLVEMIKRVETAYGENLEYAMNYLKQVYGDAAIDNALANIREEEPMAREKQYSVGEYQNEYAAQSGEAQKAIDELAQFYQRYQEIQAKLDAKPIDIQFQGIPTPAEQQAVVSLFETYKAKQQEILDMTIQDFDGNRAKIQETMAEVVALQKQLRGADLGANATDADYTATYGLFGLQDGQRLKNLIDGNKDIYDIEQILKDQFARKQQKVMSMLSDSMQNMLATGTEQSVGDYLAQHAKTLQSAAAATQQADANAAASKQRLQTEQDITEEKQRQAAIDQQQAAQTTTDATTTQTQAQNVQAEAVAMGNVLQQVEAVKAAVLAKTAAFEAEGQSVTAIAQQEIDALKPLLDLLTQIQNSLQVIFAANNWNIGDVNLAQDKTSGSSMPNILGEIKSLLGEIRGILSKSTGVDADNKNSAHVKAPVVNNNAMDSDAYKALAAKIPDDIAKDGTLQQILSAVNVIAKKPTDSNKTDLAGVATALITASTELKAVANGIVQHQKASKSDTSVAQARITDPKKHQEIIDSAKFSVANLGTEPQIRSLKALANGLVQVDGAFKNAYGQWEGFTVRVNEANEAMNLATDSQSAFAKALKDAEDNQVKYTPDETYQKALQHMQAENAKGRKTTLQYQDSGRYTVSSEEDIGGGLSRKTFQTFDENQAAMSRTTITLANDVAQAIREANKAILDAEASGNIANEGLLTKYKAAHDELEKMNAAYSGKAKLDPADTEKWNNQIALVRQLGHELTVLMKVQQKVDSHQGVVTSGKRLQEYELNANKLFKETGIGLTGAKTAEQDAVITAYDKLIQKVDDYRKSHTVLTDSQKTELETLQTELKTAIGNFNTKNQENAFKAQKPMAEADFEAYRKSMLAAGVLTSELVTKLQQVETALQNATNLDELKAWQNAFEAAKQEIADFVSTMDGMHGAAKATLTGEDLRKDKLEKSLFELDDSSLQKDNVAKAVDDYTKAYMRLEKAEQAVKNTRDLTSTDGQAKVKELEDAKKACDEYAAALQRTIGIEQKIAKNKASNKITGIGNKISKEFGALHINADADNLSKEQQDIVDTYNALMETLAEYKVMVSNGVHVSMDAVEKEIENLRSKMGAYKQTPQYKDMFAAKKNKQVASFNLDRTKLYESIAVPESFKQEIEDVGNAMKNAVDDHALKIAQDNWVTLRKRIEDAAHQQDLYIKKAGAVGQVNKNAYGATSVNTAQGKLNALKGDAEKYSGNGWKDIETAYAKAKEAMDNLVHLQSQFKGTKIDSAQQAQFVQYRDAANAARRDLEKLLKAADEFNSKTEGRTVDVMGDVNVDNRNSRGDALRAYAQEVYGAKAQVRGFNADMTELQFTIRNTDGTVENLTAAFNSAKTQMGILHGEAKKAVTVWDLLGNKMGELWRYALARMGVDDIIRYVRQGVQYVREIDTALTELKKVTNETDATYDHFLQTMSKTASTVGSTVKDLVSSAADWGRLNI